MLHEITIATNRLFTERDQIVKEIEECKDEINNLESEINTAANLEEINPDQRARLLLLAREYLHTALS